MRILGIDYGSRKVGLALSVGPMADPYKVIRYNSEFDLFSQLKAIIEDEQIEKIIVGLSEGISAGKQKEFASKLYQELDNVDIDLFDETLSTYDAQTMSREAGIKRSKRKSLEDAYAAAVILQRYLDS
jgi:putative Holliday junction resolvase